MITEKDTIKCEAVFNEDRTHRFLWKRVWDKDKPLVCVIALNPCLSDNIVTDTTTALCINNVARLENYGGLQIVNLYSLLTSKLNFRWNSDEDLNAPENDQYIKKAVEESEIAVLAWGRVSASNDRIAERAVDVINMLMKYKDKLVTISDGERNLLHPLTPSVRSQWFLEKVEFETIEEFKIQITEKLCTETKPRKAVKKVEEESKAAESSFEVVLTKDGTEDEKIESQ